MWQTVVLELCHMVVNNCHAHFFYCFIALLLPHDDMLIYLVHRKKRTFVFSRSLDHFEVLQNKCMVHLIKPDFNLKDFTGTIHTWKVGQHSYSLLLLCYRSTQYNFIVAKH